MLKSILLLTPVYTCLFWSVLLTIGSKKEEKPRRFLGVFMIFAFWVYFSHFLYFSNYTDIYYFIDPFYQLASLIVYPLFYIYFRLLTIESEFSFKQHAKYISIPFILFFLYSLGYIFADKYTLLKWIDTKEFLTGDLVMDYLYYIKILIRIGFIVQILVIIYSNFRLIKKYGQQAGHYYSDIDDTLDKRIKWLNTLLILTATSSAVVAALGRAYFQDNLIALGFAAVVFSTMLFMAGWFGFRQKSLNPQNNEIDKSKDEDEIDNVEEGSLSENQQKILEKLLVLFTEKKLHLDSKLNIVDVANEVGTNRTYLSLMINQKFNYNFCTFVNEFRIQELEQKIQEDPKISNQILCESCGFGSIESMRRVILNKTGTSFTVWKNTVINQACN